MCAAIATLPSKAATVPRNASTVALLTMLGVASAQQTGTLRVKVNPGRTGVFVDGKYVGPAKNLGHTRRYKLAAGEHEVVLREPRYQDQSQKVTITAGKTTTIAKLAAMFVENFKAFEGGVTAAVKSAGPRA